MRESEREIHANTRAHTQILYGYFAELPESIMVVSHAVSRKDTSVPTPLFTNATETHAAAGASSVGGAVVVFVQPPFGLKQVISDQPPYSMMMLQQKQCVLFDVMNLVTERERERERERCRHTQCVSCDLMSLVSAVHRRLWAVLGQGNAGRGEVAQVRMVLGGRVLLGSRGGRLRPARRLRARCRDTRRQY